ncbi:PIR Superfamily Protein [Plasmodium ovale curtisi]|uniref:PIR Superfamily Protein n=1 Tax=Plasmodium ovale curtisi TaxID=864141 RepID=A0A1A8X6F5_PLAOA|nr:PIR Superfamily Protein [Plasmodium ovale curtisi]SBT00203.1 PIR Superfamily Protein [Plasmodium ovale curtisi]
MAVERLKSQYKFLKNWPEYTFEGLRGIISSSYADTKCGKVDGYNKYRTKNNCVKFYSILDKLINNVGLNNSNYDIWADFVGRIYTKEHEFSYDSPVVESLIYNLGKLVEDNLLKNFNAYKYIHGNNTEVLDTMKLYYFSKNLGNIDIIMRNPDDIYHVDCCKFINHSLDIFKKYKDTKCGLKLNDKNNGSTICIEIEAFLSNYKDKLLPTLKSMGNVDPKGDTPITTHINCPMEVPTYTNGFFSYLKNGSTQLTPLGVGTLSFLIALGVFLVILTIYKFTPLGPSINPQMRRKKRVWGNIEEEYSEEFYPGDQSTNRDNRHIQDDMRYRIKRRL